jgi:hypothetical protein
MTYAIHANVISAARAAALTKGVTASGMYSTGGGEQVTQYHTPFGLVSIQTNTWGEVEECSILRFEVTP